MKRRQLTFCIGVVFITWNVLTYIFVARAPPGKTEGLGYESEELRRQLDELQDRLREQVNEHASLLSQLDDIRRDLQKRLLPNKSTVAPVGRFGEVGGAKNGGDAANGGHKEEGEEEDVVEELDPNKVVLPILVIACNRPDAIKRSIDQLLKYRPSAERFPIIVSQDCGDAKTADVIRSYGNQVTHKQHPDLSDIQLPWNQRKFQGYYKIARHYKWALQQIFHQFNYQAVIIVEDDLDISPDFFEYFAATYPILHEDSSLWCVSAWNDNGKENMVADEPETLHRTDFFPGLGWMLERKTWLEIEDKWPKTFWDDWMRHPDQRKERACIRPELSRTRTFGKKGVSKGQFFEKHLKYIKLNDKFVPFTQKDLSYLMKDNYDDMFVKKVYSTPLLTIGEVTSQAHREHTTVRVQYTDKAGFKAMAKQLGIMDDLKSGVPRAGYRGTVMIQYKGRSVILSPPPHWKGYDVTWN